MLLVAGALWSTWWQQDSPGELRAVLWTASLGAGLIAMVVFQAARREAFTLHVIQWFSGLEEVLAGLHYPLGTDSLRPLGDHTSGLFVNHGGWVLLIRAPGILVRGEIARQQYVRVISERLSGAWDVGWAESFLRDLLEGEARQNGVVIALPEAQGEINSLLCWMRQSRAKDIGVGIVVALPSKAGGSPRLVPGVLNAALDMVVQRLGSLLSEIIRRKTGLGGDGPHDTLLLVRALVHELSAELHPTLVLMDGEGGSPQVNRRDVFRRVRSGLTRSGYWVDLLRDVPVIQDDFLSIAREHKRLNPILKQVVEEVRPAWPDCVFRLRLDGNVRVVGDDHLRSVIRNVLYNAGSFSPEDGVIDVRASHDGLYARVYVDDDGPGVDPDRVESIFDPYVASSRSTDPAGNHIRQGMGIGLSVARTITRAYGGDLRCHSNRSAGGGRFEIMLPLAPGEEKSEVADV
jgi:signal transduction histidine kinase